MREILFRGRRKNGLEWMYGSYMEHYYSSRYGRVSAIFTNDDSLRQTYRIPVDPETVGQFTGLTDKNGKKIFDGDIVKLFLCDGEDVGVIKWSDIGARFKFASSDGCAYGIDCTTEMQVIGNIHDNPDLLEGGAEDGK